jgi:hypothetical protein
VLVTKYHAILQQKTSRYGAFFLPSYTRTITLSFLLHLYTISSLPSDHLRQAIKVAIKLKKAATTSYSEKGYFHHDFYQEIAYSS